ncbi:MAG: DUF1330 domain-containing protein [Deltaproteobacteria bacterium]|nr:DUF1330 domain-containing protein [Deltaproteobacteria bacterium]MBW2363200.1 DUF1330 domain-containing protein [Deltaproteobacteria bacterium]
MTRTDLTPSTEQVEALRDKVGPGPVVMLNLLKFREPGGREAFARYGALAAPLIARQGGEIFYLAPGGPTLSGETWDQVVMVRFPDIEAFIGLAADPEYQQQAPALRKAALERTLWMVTQPPEV